MKKLLSQILPAFEHQIVSVDGENIAPENAGSVPVETLVFDSREVVKNSLFFALPGTHVDGNKFIPQAIKNGANAVVFQGDFSPELSQKIAFEIAARCIENELSQDNLKFAPVLIKVPDARFAMAPLSESFYDSPSKRLVVIGVTGTEGKSSTVSFIWQLLNLLGKKAGFISTVEYSFGGPALPNPQHQTTPESPIIQHHLNEMLKNGCEYAVVEASSHGLSNKLNRLGNLAFDCGVFMNVTLEHLEFHKDFETYRNDKANLFRKLDKFSHVKTIAGIRREINSVGIVNLEDPSAEFFAKATSKKVIGFTTHGLAGKAAAEGKPAQALPAIPSEIDYITAKDIVSKTSGISFTVIKDGKELPISAPLPGAFNAYNLMASALAVQSVTGIDFEQVASKIPELVPVKGRMTVINQGQPFEVIVDYAHTPSSFETIFPPIRKRAQGKIFAVFGSGGERDLTKRPLQGEIASRYCDTVILADEDPRGEDPVELLKMIAAGCKKLGKIEGKDYFIIHDRKEAIRKTFAMAKKDDIVLLLGKSHENSIIFKDYVMPYDEIAEAKLALSEMGFNGEYKTNN